MAKRSDAKTCKDACRARRSRRKRGAGTPERKRRQREGQLRGLDKKFAYRQRGQARSALQNLGLVPSNPVWLSEGGEKDGEKWRFDTTPVGPEVRNRETGQLRLWSPADSFSRQEVFLGFRDGANPPPGWHSGPYWPKSEGPADFWPDQDRDDARIPHGFNGNIYGDLRAAGELFDVRIFDKNDVRIGYRASWWLIERKRRRARLKSKNDAIKNRNWRHKACGLEPLPLLPTSLPKTFACGFCRKKISVRGVLDHKCDDLGFVIDLTVTLTYLGDQEWPLAA